MESIIKYVFLIIGAMVVSLILFSLIFGSAGQTSLHNHASASLVREYNFSTFHDGSARSETVTNGLENYPSASWGH